MHCASILSLTTSFAILQIAYISVKNTELVKGRSYTKSTPVLVCNSFSSFSAKFTSTYPLFSMSDQKLISPYNINTVLGRKVVRRKNEKNRWILFDITLILKANITPKSIAHNAENSYLDLVSERVNP